MTIVEKIIHSITDATELPVYYHDEPTLNEMTSKMSMPCALFLLLNSGRPVMEGGQLKERVTAALFFVNRSDFDFNAVENERIIDACKQNACKWLASLPSSHLLTMESINGTERVYDKYDDILTGFGVSLDIKEAEGICVPSPVVVFLDFNNDFNNDFGVYVQQP